MNERLFPGEEVIPNEVNDDDNGSMEENESNISLQEKLKIRLQELERCKASVKSSQKVLPSKQFSNELDIFEATGEMTTRIKSLFDALKTIPPHIDRIGESIFSSWPLCYQTTNSFE